MSISLQLGLAVAGGAVLAGLVAHGIWEARKNQPRKAEPDLDSAVASADEHQPTAMREAAADGATASAEQALAQPNDAQHMHPVDFAAHGMPQTQAAVKKPLDLLIDAIASIELDAGAVVSGEAALAGLPASRRVGDKPFAVEGRNVSTQEWEPPQAGQQYDAFQAGVQLANRSGALNEIGFSEFTLKAQAFADAVNGTPHFPDMIDEVALYDRPLSAARVAAHHAAGALPSPRRTTPRSRSIATAAAGLASLNRPCTSWGIAMLRTRAG